MRLGLGEIALRIGTGLASIALIMIVLWVMGTFYLKGNVTDHRGKAAMAAPLPTATPTVAAPEYQPPAVEASFSQGIARLALMHTTLPARPRFEISQYEVEKGDTIMGIAEKFGLKPQTILWGNYYTLADDPHRLRPGQKLNILPVDGVYYEWHEGDGLNGVARFFGVQPEDIVNWQGNHLDVNTLGDWAKPNIAKGTWLIIPGGQREFVTWSGPALILLFLSALPVYLRRPTRAGGLLLAFLLTYLALNLLGQTHGEVQRLWIFLLPPVCLYAAPQTRKLFPRAFPGVALALTLQLLTALLTYAFQDFYG